MRKKVLNVGSNDYEGRNTHRSQPSVFRTTLTDTKKRFQKNARKVL